MKRFLAGMMMVLTLAGCGGGKGTTTVVQQGAQQSQVDALNSQVTAMQSQLSQLALINYQTQMDALVAGNATLSGKVDAAVSKAASDKAASDAAMAIAQTQIAGFLVYSAANKLSTADLQSQINSLATVSATTAALAALESRVDAAITNSGLSSAQITDLKSKIDTLISAADGTATITAQQTSDITDLKNQMISVVANAGLTTTQITSLVAGVNTITAQITANQAAVGASLADLEARLTVSINANAGNIAAVQATLTTAVADITSIKSAITTLQAQVASIIGNYATPADVANLQAQATAIAASVSANTNAIGALQAQVAALQASVAALQAGGGGDVTALTSQVAALVTTVNATIMTQLADLTSRITAAEGNLALINAILQSLGYIQLPANSKITFTTVVASTSDVGVTAHFGLGGAGGTAYFSLVQHGGAPTGASLSANSAMIDINGDAVVSVTNMTPGVEYLVIASQEVGKVAAKSSGNQSQPIRIVGKRLLVQPVPAAVPTATKSSGKTTAMVTGSASVTVSTAAPVWTQPITLPTHTSVVGKVTTTDLGTFTLTDIWNGTATSYQLEKRDPSTGNIIWAVPTSRYDWISATDTEVYVGGVGVSRINPTNGAVMWTVPPSINNVHPGVAIPGGIILDGVSPADQASGYPYTRGVVKIDKNGNFVWSTPVAFDLTIPWNPMRVSVSDGVYVLLGNQANNQVVLQKYDLATGAVLWRTPAKHVNGGYTVSADATGAYFFTRDDGGSGNNVYHYTPVGVNDISRGLNDLFPDQFTPLVASNGCIYFVVGSYEIYKLDVSGGNDKYVYLDSNNGVVTSLSLYGSQMFFSTGSIAARYDNM